MFICYRPSAPPRHLPPVAVPLVLSLPRVPPSRFTKGFELTLLYQSLAVMVCQSAMIALCVRVKHSHRNTGAGIASVQRRRKFRDFDLEYFWAWDDFSSYMEFLAVLCAGVAVPTLLAFDSPVYVESLGVLALGVESTPQVYRNHAKKSTLGLK